MWMLLTPREAEAVQGASAKGANGAALAMVKGKLRPMGPDTELDLTLDELLAVREAAYNWADGGEKAFRAILAARDRHR
jgi:formiminotetrahydrofolate cyclodeaminase